MFGVRITVFVVVIGEMGCRPWDALMGRISWIGLVLNSTDRRCEEDRCEEDRSSIGVLPAASGDTSCSATRRD